MDRSRQAPNAKMAVLAALTLALLCISAQAAPAFKALEDDVAAARTEAVSIDIESLEFANDLNVVDLKTDIEARPISADIINQLRALNINNQEVNRIETLFSDSFDIIQEAVRRIERALRQLRQDTLSAIINDLDNSNWGSLRDGRQVLEEEINRVHALYQQAKEELNTTLANLETNLNEAVADQETADIVAVLSNWQRIKDFFDLEFLALEDTHIVWSVRAGNTITALDVVLAQV